MFQRPDGITFVSNGPVQVVEPTGEVLVDADVLKRLEEEGEADGGEEEESAAENDSERVDGEEEAGAVGADGGGEGDGATGPRQRKRWPQYLVRKGEPDKVHLQKALHLLQPKVERPNKERSKRVHRSQLSAGLQAYPRGPRHGALPGVRLQE